MRGVGILSARQQIDHGATRSARHRTWFPGREARREPLEKAATHVYTSTAFPMLEAKCYGSGNSVGVREMSRLISRLRHRQFGVLVTTS
ncbi:O-acetyl-ADP-ribose deacetylase (regulator of RNase III) [Bradyrhizobium japonicum]|uniref:O-acetyl-ADP-ribose deacetylase (Regulator of RNase III) n=1 Tax=Bradyrhizobium japonicum TaxID=375 RepID=A0ABV2RLB9_BRAJP|nr:O-acetyl-ADP-ribose deacetylase (regulator of RNase III) [Bradyrhizobium japonicum]MCP1794040.1 O-acetyl-ADP-ribose deacetylase (regulator of RNase III) [Bradyrhizobium japonicum]MCP1806474.1 O-acetyl-ADP-ribose deacetylase (regulator of RNase III) [Bradyrhizobium japonicum]MCP1815401.1 O-acetyl-ADP-ribose deacetylase (regulator of RNase III) [Bradyrhizobium japonicum]MCP1873082.1 O-acetyl-ADP-ribose deacetylase (regulator of RNase III) [Bradyrhizobium japonicum]